MDERARRLLLSGALGALAVVLSVAVLGSHESRRAPPQRKASFTNQCFWSVTVDGLHGDAKVPCDEVLDSPPSREMLEHARLYCPLDTLEARPRPAPRNDLANCDSRDQPER